MSSEPFYLVCQESILIKESGSYCKRMSEILRWQILWRCPERAETVGGGCGMSGEAGAAAAGRMPTSAPPDKLSAASGGAACLLFPLGTATSTAGASTPRAVSSVSNCIAGASGAKSGGCQMPGGTAGALTEVTVISASECKQCLAKYATSLIQGARPTRAQ